MQHDTLTTVTHVLAKAKKARDVAPLPFLPPCGNQQDYSPLLGKRNMTTLLKHPGKPPGFTGLPRSHDDSILRDVLWDLDSAPAVVL